MRSSTRRTTRKPAGTLSRSRRYQVDGPSYLFLPAQRSIDLHRSAGLRAPDRSRVGLDEEPRSVRLRIDLAYDGSGFSGWAAQPGRRTVEDVLAAALGRILRLPHPPGLTVAGRTDAGVHARGQVVHADVPAAAWPAAAGGQASTAAAGGQASPAAAGGQASTAAADRGVLARLAAVLPADVRVHAVGPAPDGFDARFSALWRRADGMHPDIGGEHGGCADLATRGSGARLAARGGGARLAARGGGARPAARGGGAGLAARGGGPAGRGYVGVRDLPAGVHAGVSAPGDGQARRMRQPQDPAERRGQDVLDRTPAGLGGPAGKP